SLVQRESTTQRITLGFSGAARNQTSYVAGNTMEKMLSPRPLQAIVRRAVERKVYFEYLPRHLKELVSLSSGLFRIFTQYSSLTSSSISTRFAYSESRPSFLQPEIQYCAPVSTSAKLALKPVPFKDPNSRPR